MKKMALAVLTAATIGTVSLSATRASSSETPQTVVVDNMSATVNLEPIRNNDVRIQVRFTSNATYFAGCLSTYRDLRYQLVDGSNRVMSISQQTLMHPPSEGPWLGMHLQTDGGLNPCRTYHDEWNARALLSALYPNLAPGKYMLHIIFAPHFVVQTANFGPIPITIDPSPGPT